MKWKYANKIVNWWGKNSCEILSCKIIFINEQKSADYLRKNWHIVQLEKEYHLNNARSFYRWFNCEIC